MGFYTKWQLNVFDPPDGMSYTFLVAANNALYATNIARTYSYNVRPVSNNGATITSSPPSTGASASASSSSGGYYWDPSSAGASNGKQPQGVSSLASSQTNATITSLGPAGSASQPSVRITAVDDTEYISISPGDVIYFVNFPSDQYSYHYGFHYKSLKFFEFHLDSLSLFRPILIEQDVIDMNLKYNNHHELEPHLRHVE